MSLSDETKYSYQKRIKELEEKNDELSDKLYNYRTTALEIYDAVAENAGSGDGISKKWILQKFRKCLQ